MTRKEFGDTMFMYMVLLALFVGSIAAIIILSANKHHAEVMEQLKGCTTQTQVK